MRFAPSLLILSLLAASASAAPIGRILVAVGDVSAQRNGKTVPLKARAEIELGDLIKTGPASNAQIRLTDGSIIAIKPVTEFKFDDYQFTGKQDGTEKGAFSLVKGGFRTITGAIGKQNPQNYKVATPMANIGIRGTFYNLAICDSGCFNPDGSKAKDGLYGGVVDGKIAVSNTAGEKTFGNDEFFHVASANETPQGLIAPPSFLQDKLEGQKQSKKEKEEGQAEAKPQAQTTKAEDGGSGFKGDSRAGVVTDTGTVKTEPVVGASDDSYKATEDKTISDTPIPVVGVKQFLLAHSFGDGQPYGAYPNEITEFHGLSDFIFLNQEPVGVITDAKDLVLIDASLQDIGHAKDTGGNLAVFWGKWMNGTITVYNSNGSIDIDTLSNFQAVHFIGGVAPSSLPTGSVTYNYLANASTKPSFSDGSANTNSAVTGGSVTINFTTLAASASLTLNLDHGGSLGGYTLATTTGSFNPTTFGITGSGNTTFNTGTDGLNCGAGNCPSYVAGFVAGPGGTHVGLGYGIHANTLSAPLQVNGVAAFQTGAQPAAVTGSLYPAGTIPQ
ncbi:FecR family protein [Sulfuritortus calidifontis]|uniref:FecR family protein n=1 Tax=Sulfuritortus calidifontis TaxID=1914471 RepID=A0A4R3JRW3_9PROT|nr:FecR family protein [Sulfuritortus calidifontis]TCS69729.1 FecR family protein [Sulfuritortus calidifontis]